MDAWRFLPQHFSNICRVLGIVKPTPTNLIGRFNLIQGTCPSLNPIKTVQTQKCCLSTTVKIDVNKEVATIGEKFKDSLELLEDAKSSFGTVYFSEDMKEAETLIEETLSDFRQLLAKLNDDQKREVRRKVELKMNELKAQLQILQENAKTILN